MAFFKANVAEAAKASTGGNYISKSGVYDVTIKAITVDVNDKGARTLGFYVSHNDQDQMLYGALRLDNNDGSPSFQASAFNKLCIIAGLEDVSDPEEATLPIGKEGADKDVAVLPDFTDLDVKMWIQFEYSIVPDGYAKAGEISEKRLIKGFYAPDGTSADEIINETESGVRFAKDSKYHENTSYKDGLTEESVQAWIAAGRKGSPAPSKSAAPKPSFGKKFGAK